MDYPTLKERLSSLISGDVSNDPADLRAASRDMSIFERTPSLVVFPKDASDVVTLVREVNAARETGLDVSLTARAAGTDMSGGPLSHSIVVSFTRYMNHMGEVGDGYAITEPGVFYRDFEKATLAKGLILPSYPASRELAAMGGIVSNNSAGERTLKYGQTERYIEEVDVVLADGSQATFGPLTPEELEKKKALQTLEGKLYREMDALLTEHAATIEEHRPKVSKNAAGYALWNIRDAKTGTVNFAKLICGSQGTLALWTRAKLALVPNEPSRALVAIFVNDTNLLPEIVSRILPLNPESFESYDEHTFKLAIKFLPEMLFHVGLRKAISLGIRFIPDALTAISGGVPKMVLLAEFSEADSETALRAAKEAKRILADLPIRTHLAKNERAAQKYWIVRRESFRLLRKNLRGLAAAPFIDDFVVPPSSYAEFLPKLSALLNEYKDRFIYTIAGHIGNGNFHIIPLMDLGKPEVRDVILELSPKVYRLVIEHGGSTTGEHNDGIIRTPFLTELFGAQMTALFAKTEHLFDPNDIFNPGKKVGGTVADIEHDMLNTSKKD